MLRNCVIGEKRISGKAGEGDEVVNEGDESSSTRIGRSVLTYNYLAGERGHFLCEGGMIVLVGSF